METFEQVERLRIQLQDFTKRLNNDPNPAEFDKTPDGKASYLPISFIEMSLDELFLGQWGTENFKWSAITNEVQGSLELVLTHPITGKEIRRTGAASIVITVDSIDQEAKDSMSKQARNLYALNPENKKPNALDMGFPKLKAECLKNASSSLGKLFGRDINRKKKDVFRPALKELGGDAFATLVKRVEAGENTLIPLAESAFILSNDQKLILEGLGGQKQLTNG